MPALKRQLKYCVLLSSRLNINQFFSTLSNRVKLAEIPEVCTREDWSTIINECRVALQKHPIRSHPIRNGRGLITTQTVVKRIQNVSYRSNYLASTFQQLLANTEDNTNELRWPGLITLMLSKGIGNPFRADDFISKSLEDVIWSSQVTLAEIINLLYCNFVFRKESARLASTEKMAGSVKVQKEIDRLVYSYFTSVILHKTSTLSNYKVVLLLGDILESLAKKRLARNGNNQLLRNLSHWEFDAFHPQGLLLASGCQAALELAGYDELYQQMAFKFGQYFAFALKAHGEIQHHWNYLNSQSSTINISSFPIALHLQNYPETLAFVYNCNDTLNNLDAYMLNTILQSHAAMNDAKVQLEIYVQRTIGILQELKKSGNDDMIDHLIRLIKTLNNINQY